MDFERGISRREFGQTAALVLAGTLLSPYSAEAQTPDSTEQPPSAVENYLNQKPMDVLSIHVGTRSIDRNNLTQEEIETTVNAMVTNAPNLTHISIGTYFDYDDQIKMWTEAAHAKGKKIYVRSAGFNTWQGTFDEAATGTPIEHLYRVINWIDTNYGMFEDGDIFEPVPDEASNGKYWFENYGDGGVGSTDASKNEFNLFIQQTISDARREFNENGKPGVVVEVYHDNPSVIKDVLTEQTVDTLSMVGTNNYPEQESDKTPEKCAAAMLAELNTWVVGAHNLKAWILTIGPNLRTQLNQENQRDALEKELEVIFATLGNLVGIALWQFGDKGEEWPTRLFDYANEQWEPRKAVQVLSEIKTFS